MSPKHFELGRLEAEVLKAMKRLDLASVREVLEELNQTKHLAYTTVGTTLDRLFRKGLLARETLPGKARPKYIYSLGKNMSLERDLVNEAVDRFMTAFGPSVVSTIYRRLIEVSPEASNEEFKKIREFLERER
jgi:predicted transcriptional regulator